ncbi:DUF3017 domain-containing protein [Cellulomonas uda]|uniref:DUF3017 domain-containing protein n=1 Tax=Cellulomonas uda TaxID=1714 RepID=UPI00141B70E7|nr:DUF3017 domain-containing protein [Cellulomonas uda]NII65106.1 hypothetical protein [Cellulomonas uda]
MVHERVHGQSARTTTHGTPLPGAPAGWSAGPATPAPEARAGGHEPAPPPQHARPASARSSAASPVPAAGPAKRPAPASTPASTLSSTPGGVPEDVPPAERPLDPRAIARASLEASRNASLWWTAAGVALACLVALVAGTPAGAWTLSALLAAGAGVRAVRPEPGPVAWAVRSRALDVTVLCFLAVSIAVLAAILPTPES